MMIYIEIKIRGNISPDRKVTRVWKRGNLTIVPFLLSTIVHGDVLISNVDFRLLWVVRIYLICNCVAACGGVSDEQRVWEVPGGTRCRWRASRIGRRSWQPASRRSGRRRHRRRRRPEPSPPQERRGGGRTFGAVIIFQRDEISTH